MKNMINGTKQKWAVCGIAMAVLSIAAISLRKFRERTNSN
jgi:hypothetical protein